MTKKTIHIEIPRKSYQDLVNDPATDLDLLDLVEEQLIVAGVNRPLRNSTPPAEWDAYWQRVADVYEWVAWGAVLPAPGSRFRPDPELQDVVTLISRRYYA